MGAFHSGLRFSLIAFVFAAWTIPRLGATPIDASLTAAQKRQLQQEARLVVDLLQNYHYSGHSFREIENKEMVDRFLTELDAGSYFFSPDDLTFLHRRFDRTFKSVYLLRGDLQPAFEIFDLFATRSRERGEWIEQRLKRGFDFTVDEDYVEPVEPVGGQTAPPPAEPADRRWELLLKEQVLQEILAGRDGPAAVAVVSERYQEMARQITAVDSLAVRERFFDAVIRSFDPHSGYFSADSAREFAAGMENAVAGVGLELRKDKGLCVVSAVQPGSPADLQTDIQAGDIIDELGAGDEPRVDASRRPLRELVALVCGQPGTKLHLAYHFAGTTDRREVTLEQTRVLLGAERAHGAISVVPAGGRDHHIGWIVLPTFYAAGEGGAATSATRDVRDLLEQMIARGIEGLVLDLRGNPGGAMPEAIALSGLFIPAGPVVLSRGIDGVTAEQKVDVHTPLFTGPLVVLTSPQSASASEVFSGAMKFHRRAVIAGGPSTFGKGTVQNYIELGKARQGLVAAETADWGTLRLTAQRFYLPDGGTVQRDGVGADIPLLLKYSGVAPRETELPHALTAEVIAPPSRSTPANETGARPMTVSPQLLAQLHAKAEADLKDLPEWQLWRDVQARRESEGARKKFSLRLPLRQSERTHDRADWDGLWQRIRQLTPQVTYTTEALELGLLHPAVVAHEGKLKAARDENGETLLWRLHRGTFTLETTQGRLRTVRLSDIDFENYEGDAAQLASAFDRGAGFRLQPAELKLALREVSLLDIKTDPAVVACFLRHDDSGHLDAKAAGRGIDALLRELTILDGEWLRDRPGLDAPMRECLRLTADWAGGTATPP